MLLLRIKPRSSGRTASSLDSWAISPAPKTIGTILNPFLLTSVPGYDSDAGVELTP